MKKSIYLFIVALPYLLASCGGGGAEELTMNFGSEKSELEGNPSTVREIVIDFEDVAPDSAGDTLYINTKTYDTEGNVLTHIAVYPSGHFNNFTQVFEYDSKGRVAGSVYTEEGDVSYTTKYTYKGNLIAKAQYYVDGEPTNYYKYTYKGNKETSRNLFSSLGIKISQTDFTWAGDRVVKEVETEDGEVTVKSISYPDDNTEVISVSDGDDEPYYISTLVYNDKGDFLSIRSDSYDPFVRLYSYEYDSTGNWTKRTVTDESGRFIWMELREITYY
ncbi:MAG: hypothetical protein LUF87_03410 [Alistipes sp.]|nr:hypothetical protein [Alistipes sp.]